MDRQAAPRPRPARSTWSSRSLALLAVAVLGLGACSNDSDSAEPTTTTAASETESTTPPVTGQVSLPPTEGADGKFIDADAQQLCSLQGQGFASEGDIAAALTATLTEAGISEDEWADWKSRSAADESLRGQVSERYLEQCGGAVTGTTAAE